PEQWPSTPRRFPPAAPASGGPAGASQSPSFLLCKSYQPRADQARTVRPNSARGFGQRPEGREGETMPWVQVYDPFGNQVLSTLAAVIPIGLLLVMVASGRIKAHWAALIALAVGIAIAVYAFTMPLDMALRATALGALSGFFPIGW